MHPGLGVLIYSHQFQVRWSQRAQVAGRSAGRWRAGTATTPARGRVPCPYLMQALDTKTNPKKRTPPSLTTWSSKIQTLSVISATSPFVWREYLYNKSSSLPNPTWYFWIICVSVTRGHTQLPQFWCHRCLLDAHVKPTTTFTARDRNQQLKRSASTRTLYPDASARSGRATNHHDHVGVTMLAFTFVGNEEERGGGLWGWGGVFDG